MLRDSFLPEFDHEVAVTRNALEQVSDFKLAWRPHEKSFTLGGLSSHIAQLCHWGVMTLQSSELDLAPGGVPMPPNPEAATVTELLNRFNQTSAAMRAALSEATDEQLLSPWTLLNNGHTLMTMPRIAVLRSFVMNHLIHHRGQLSVYLRLTGSTVPSMYGPSADDPGQ